MKLFKEPFDLPAIDAILRTDWTWFSSCAFIVCGRHETWMASLEQVRRLLEAYEVAGRDDRPVWQIVTLLIASARRYDDAGRLLDCLVERLGLQPGTAYFEEIKMTHLHKTDPVAWRKKHHREWADSRRATRSALRAWPAHRAGLT